jgi:hypothetical protein
MSFFTDDGAEARTPEPTGRLGLFFLAVDGAATVIGSDPGMHSHERLSGGCDSILALDFAEGNSQVSITKPQSFLHFINGDLVRSGGRRAPFIITDA